MHRAARIVSTALITAGVVVLLDVGITLAWQEPVSSLYGWLQQRSAAGELSDLEARYPTAADRRAIHGLDDPRAARVLARRFTRQLHRGEAIGRIEVPRIGLDIVIVQGTDTASLQKGPGHYPGTPLPGLPGTTAIAGHRTTYLAPFRDINRIEPGDEMRLEMPYADFTYRVQKHEVVAPGDVGIVRSAGYQRLLLTACHPLYSAAQRYAVFARLSRLSVPER